MNPKSLRQHVVEHYGGKSLSNGAASRLVELATSLSAAGPASASGGVRRGRWLIGALAASVAVLAAGNGYFALQARDARARLDQATRKFAAHMDDQQVPGGPPGDGRSSPIRLVALRVCATWCSNCATIGPLFEDLQEKYGEDRVRFAFIDITDERTRTQYREQAGHECAAWMAGECKEAGVIRLFDCRRQKVLADVSSAEDVPGLEAAIRLAMGD